MDSAKNKTYGWVMWVLCALWFAGCHVWHTLPAWQDPLWRVPGPMGDNTVMLWNLGWVKYALDHGQPGFWFPNAYYPDGFLFLFGTHTWLDGLLGWLASPLLPGGWHGPMLWANITLLMDTVLTGLCLIAALAAWGVRRWPLRLLVASVVTFSWFRMFALQGHYHFYGTQWMLASLALLSWSRRFSGERRDGTARRCLFAGGLLLGVAFLNDQTMAVFCGVLSVPLLLGFGGVAEGRAWVVQLARRAMIYYGWAFTVACVHLVPIVVCIKDGRFHYWVDTASACIVDASSMFLPPTGHFAEPLIRPWREAHHLAWAEGTYIGLGSALLLVIAIVGAMRAGVRKQVSGDQRPIMVAMGLALLFLLFALGDTFTVGTHTFFALPGKLLKSLPLVNAIRLPQRWVWPAHLCIALAGGLTLQRWWDAHPRRWWAPALLALAVIAPLEGQSWPWPAPVDYRHDTRVNPPGLVEAIKTHYRGGGVLLMPVDPPLSPAYSQSNIFQFLWGYDIPVTIAYTARIPQFALSVPWDDNRWNPKAGEWLKQRKVKVLVFPYADGAIDRYGDWLDNARRAVPGLQVFSRDGLVL